ncbi:MAG TPA: HD-GYP domain-containing protein [Candidatus Dormibacteraeota bacterium]|nr:HD-GYP domain-containing protein [Candidatus Dormibacteraeota bacterium]
MSTTPRVIPTRLRGRMGSPATATADAQAPQRDRSEIAPGPAGSRGKLPVYLVVGVVSALATGVGAVWVRPPFQWATLALVVGLVGLLESGGAVSFQLGRSKFNFSAKAYASIGAVYLLGMQAAIASAVASLVISVWMKRAVSVKTLFNAAMSILVYGTAYGVFDVLRRASNGDVWLLVVAGAIGGFGAWVINHLLLGAVIAAEQGISRFNATPFVRSVTPLSLYYIGYGLTGVGVLAASFHIGAPAALVTLAAPVAIVQTATNRWIKEQHARVDEARSGFNATLISLSKAIDLRDKDTEGHCRRVVDYSLLMGRHLKFNDEELTRLCHGALLHDIGKIGVSDSILLKPGPLTDEEWAIMRTHPELGFMMVADVRQLEKAREIILNHHERYDGKGYPNGIRGEAIPLGARLFTIADAFDAMISDRPYRRGMGIQAARDEVRRCSGTQFDPICVAAFEKISDDELDAIAKEREHPTEEMLSF